MKRYCIIGLLCFISITQLNAWELIQPTGGRANSLGKCSVSLCDFWSSHNTPAGFASHKQMSIGISYDNKFLLKELGYKNLGFLIPINWGVINLSASQFGYDLYNENIIGLGFARKFGPNFRLGLKFDYLLIKFSENYNNFSSITFECGIQYQINKNLCFGAYIFNPIIAKIKSLHKDKIPIIMRIGFSYMISDDFLITGEIEENFEQNFSYRFGVEYKIHKKMFLRSGYQLRPEIFTFGLGYDINDFCIDIYAHMNHELGASLGCSLIFKIKRNIFFRGGLS